VKRPIGLSRDLISQALTELERIVGHVDIDTRLIGIDAAHFRG
jgi:hypothetical protein